MANTTLSEKERINLISSIGEEIIGHQQLERLLTNKPYVVAYDGFEPSGRMHIAQGLLRSHNVNKFVRAGVHFKFWVADWFALMNLKLGGDIKKIQSAGENMILMWKACGMDLDAVDSEGRPMIQFIWSSKEINARSDEYWKLVLDIGTKFGLNRIKKCTQIMGRKEEENISDVFSILKAEYDQNQLLNKQYLNDFKTELNNIMSRPANEESKDNLIDEINKLLNSYENNLFHTQSKTDANFKLFEELFNESKIELAASQIFYPVMQCADIFFLGVDICSLGIDQRKVNMLAIEYCDKIKRKNKPIIVSHHMLMGLDGSDKMSKSNPDNTIFMDDTVKDIQRKIRQAFCEPNNITKNPLLDWLEFLILPIVQTINIKTRTSDNSKPDNTESDQSYTHIEEIRTNFVNSRIHPKSLKQSITNVLIGLLVPIQTKYNELKS